MSEYQDMTVAELKVILKELGLSSTGKKADLIERLEAASEDTVEEEPTVMEDADEEVDDDDDFDDFDDDWDDDGEEEIHRAKQKPELDDETRKALATRDAQGRKQPKFRRQEWYRYKRLSRSGWRKPKGYQSKQRLNMKYRTPMARVGYGKIKAARDLHPSGFVEVLVHNTEGLDGLDPATQAIRIGRGVGNRKRSAIHDKADELGIRILNRRSIEKRGDL
ncbi:MAG: 50S ribosomal protein L32e [Candidatus Poseidoniales archaeon]|nr:MAG: 50S ribosomal protein L32e [Euryarchaeota archaeon TMED255]RAH10257.1 MAG: 50S ribosomal protein L32e [Euryarchaeota archaeon]RCH74295.1 MAG: 50S ribosomal protein L32e [Candidatus Poseidoniales archaeon]|tara:strand:+ start:567 stop:1229 length:663 start_codon:yes stop_codon:yes gene_type:complete